MEMQFIGDGDEIPMRNTDQYSMALNIQNPSVESRFWEEKMLMPNK